MSLSREVKSFFKTILLLILCIIACIAGLILYGRYKASLPVALTREEIMAQIIVEATLTDEDVQTLINSYIPENAGNSNLNVPVSHEISMEIILQNPELPAGCEVTSLAMLLTHLGLPADKCVLSDSYLPKGEAGKVSMNEYFIGNPREEGSYGCYAPVIAGCAASYIADTNASLKVYNLTGTNLSSLFALIADDKPVMVWTTINLLESFPTVTWEINGETVTWYSQEHCVVLTGYNYDTNTVTIADPLYGTMEYDMTLFTERYNRMFKQAICIY